MFRFNFSLWRRLNGGGLCKDFLEAQYSSAISADGLSYKDEYGEDREYHKAGSIKPDTTVFFDGDIQEFDVITCEGTAVPEVDNGYFYFSTAGSAWDIKITRAGTLIAWYPCVTGDGTVLANVLSDDGSGSVTAVNAPAGLWQEHIDGNGSNYLNEFGYSRRQNLIRYSESLGASWEVAGFNVTQGANNFWNIEKSTSDAYSSVYQLFINNKTGNLVLDIELTAGTQTDGVYIGLYKGGFGDSSAEILSGSGVVSGAGLIKITGLDSGVTKLRVVRTSVNAGDSCRLYIYPGWGPQAQIGDNVNLRFPNMSNIIGVKYAKTEDNIIVGLQPASQADTSKDWLGNQLQYRGPAGTPLAIVKAPVFVSDGAVYGANANNAGASISSQVSTATATISSAGVIAFPVGDYEEIVLSNGSFYSMTEGTPTDPSDIIYDRSGNGNHLDLLNSGTDNWDLKERESYPLVDGFTFNGANLIPALLSDPTMGADGVPIQYTDKQSMNADNPTVVSLGPSQPVIESENASGNRLFTDGSGNMEELTFSDFSTNFHDTVFYKSPDKLVIYTQPITGDCLAKTKKYFGLTEYLLGDGTDYLVDNAGANLVTGG